MISDHSGKIIGINAAARRIFGPIDISGGKSADELFPDKQADRGDKSCENSTTIKYDTNARDIDGSSKEYSVVASRIFGVDGSLGAVVRVMHDISDRVILENKLRAQAAVLTASNNEIDSSRKVLSATVHKMESALKLLRDDLDAARHMQRLLLPDNLADFAGARISFVFKPSSSVGGDLLDVRKMDGENIAIIVFDVAGHGVAAALYAAVAKTIFERRINQSISPGETLRKINDDLYSALGGELFLATFFGHLNTESMMLTYALAAFPFPILFRKSTGEAVLLPGRGAFVGMAEDDGVLTAYEDNCAYMDHGDRLLIYSDGMSEARNKAGKVWGVDQLKHAMISSITLPLSASLQMIVNEQESFCEGGADKDDRTLLMVEIV